VPHGVLHSNVVPACITCDLMDVLANPAPVGVVVAYVLA
jgi:hypothetical protein